MVMGDMAMTVDLLVIGSGPGGYGAAFRAADLGLDVALVDPRPRPGGICLYEGCIPSKTFLYLAELVLDTRKTAKMGLHFEPPKINLTEMQTWKKKVIDNMSQGLATLSDKRGVQLITGTACFESSTSVRLDASEISRIAFKHAIVATGSLPHTFPGITPHADTRIISSSGALDLTNIPENMLIIGGGYVGLELGTVYAALDSRISLVEMEDRILPAVDPDLVQPLSRRLEELFEKIYLQTRIKSLEETDKGVVAEMESAAGIESHVFDRVLVAMGRKPATEGLGLEHTGVMIDEHGAIEVDDQQRTADENIFAVGDVAGSPMLAHTATRQGRVAAEVIVGQPSGFDVRAIPAVVYTDPQIAWCGLTETEAALQNIDISVQKFPWKYSGRANTMDATDGFTKIITDPDDGRILGLGITGRNTEGLIAEGVLAIEMGALAEDIALSLHPHPTLSETGAEAAELFVGSPTHIMPTRKSD